MLLVTIVALAAGGGYALAAGNSKTITVCADKKTGVLHLKTKGRCKASQTRVTWNQQGPAGPRGVQGPVGAQGTQGAQGPAGPTGTTASAWGIVGDNGGLGPGAQGLTSQRLGPGDYEITITAPACASVPNVPTVTVSDGYPPAGQSAGAFPQAWIADTAGNGPFEVHTGVVVGGTFTPTDRPFNVQDVC
jgi:hypothetical protein